MSIFAIIEIIKVYRYKGGKTSQLKAKKLTPIAIRYRHGILGVSCSMLLLYLLVTLIYTSRAQETQFLDREYSSLKHTMESLQVLFSSVEDSSKAIVSDDIIQQTLIHPNSNHYIESQQMRKQIGRYMNSNRYIDAVIIYATNNRVYDSGSIALVDDDATLYTAVNKLSWVSTHTAPYLHSGSKEQQQVLSMRRPIYNFNNYQQIGIVEIMVQESNLTKAFLSNGAHRSFYIVDSNNAIIAHPNKSILHTIDSIPILQDNIPYHSDNTYALGKKNPHTTWQLKSTVPSILIFEPIHKILWTLFAFGIGITGISFVFSRKTATTVTHEISLLTESVRQIQDLQERLPQIATSDETNVLCTEFNNMLNKLEIASKQLVQEQTSKRKFQFELLQQQISPHFLYNTLENISSLAILGKHNELVDIVNNMARFYRGVLSKGTVRISLKNELEIADSYLRILKIRSHSRFDYSFHVADEFLSNSCIKLILQPILENSVYHGLATLPQYGHIKITAKVQGNFLLLQIIDNGKGMTAKQLSTVFEKSEENTDLPKSYGLRNIHRRLQLYFGPSYGMEVHSILHKGTTVLLRLPFEEHRKEHYDQNSVS